MREEILTIAIDVLEDPAFVEEAAKVESAEKIMELLMQHGVDLSDNEAKELLEYVLQDNEELSEDNLENVAGGMIIIPYNTIAKKAADAIKKLLKKNKSSTGSSGGGYSSGNGRHG